MSVKKIITILFVLIVFSAFSYLIYSKFFKKTVSVNLNTEVVEDSVYSSNIIKDVNYTTKDSDGNEYIITALEGEIDYSNPNIIYLTKVKAIINLKDSEVITINSDYGKYNSNNFDTIFSKNVIVKYLDNNINGEYLDFSLERNSMIISREVIYKNLENILKADVMEMNIKTKDTKIFMYEENKKVNVKNLN